jgi:hypothetical protein
MNALIIYQDLASAAKAKAALQDPSKYPDVTVQWNIRSWRVEMLKFPPTAATALDDAADAHLVVFAGCCARLFPLGLQDWLEQWARRRQIRDVALAVINSTDSGVLSKNVIKELSGFARRHGLGLVFDDRCMIEDTSEFSGLFRARNAYCPHSWSGKGAMSIIYPKRPIFEGLFNEACVATE